jgi:hypothetical protein
MMAEPPGDDEIGKLLATAKAHTRPDRYLAILRVPFPNYQIGRRSILDALSAPLFTVPALTTNRLTASYRRAGAFEGPKFL